MVTKYGSQAVVAPSKQTKNLLLPYETSCTLLVGHPFNSNMSHCSFIFPRALLTPSPLLNGALRIATPVMPPSRLKKSNLIPMNEKWGRRARRVKNEAWYSRGHPKEFVRQEHSCRTCCWDCPATDLHFPRHWLPREATKGCTRYYPALGHPIQKPSSIS